MKIEDYLLLYILGVLLFQFLVTGVLLMEYPENRHGDSIFSMVIAGFALLLVFAWPMTVILTLIIIIVPLFLKKEEKLK